MTGITDSTNAVNSGIKSKTPFRISRLQLSMVLVLLLLLQYDQISVTLFETWGRLRSLPLCVLFLSALILLLFYSDFQLPNADLITLGLLIGLVIVFGTVTIHSYVLGNTIGFPNIFTGLAVVGIAGILTIVGFVRKRFGIICIGLSFLLIACTFFQIQTHNFNETFLAGRPLWVFQNAITHVRNGIWPYLYQNAGTLSYPPFLILPYIPFGLLSIDLRWASLAGGLMLIGSLWLTSRRNWSAQRALIVVFIFASPAFVYFLLTTQLAFYWIYLLWIVLSAKHVSASPHRLSLIIASLSRQLAWSLIFPWLLHWGFRNRNSHHPGETKRGNRINLSVLRPSYTEIVLLVMVAVVIFVDSRAFYWSTFVWALADGLNAVQQGTIQPAGKIALTPLLPYAQNPKVVLMTAVGMVIAVSILLWRTKALEKLSRALVLAYAVFLSFGFMVHNYYWMDVIILALGYLWTIDLEDSDGHKEFLARA